MAGSDKSDGNTGCAAIICLVFLGVAFAWGGLWWILGILGGLGLLGLFAGDGKSKEEEKNPKSSVESKPVSSVPTPMKSSLEHAEVEASKKTMLRKTVAPADDWVEILTDICSRYSGSDYYVEELILPPKMENAIEFYPVPGGGRVVALIDATVFGSAKYGMAIGEHGISWRNNWTTGTGEKSFLWREMSNLSIKRELHNIKIGSDNTFDMSGCGFGKDQLVNLLRELVAAAESKENKISPASQHALPPTAKIPDTIDVNFVDFDLLLSLPGIGAAEAKMIQERRNAWPFSSVEELAEFVSLKPHKVEQLRSKVVFSKLSPSPLATPLKKPDVSAAQAPASQKPSHGRVID